MASSSTDDAELRLLVADVVAAAKVPPKSRQTSIKPTVAKLTSIAYEYGLVADILSDLIDLLTTPNFLDQASLAAIAKNLYPVSSVSSDVVLRVVSSLGHGAHKPSLNVQALLLRWLILAYHLIESPVVLSQAYTVLFNLIDTAATRPYLTHLLALITRRRHVKPFRIQLLLTLSRQTGNDPCLVGLLRVFKDYYPEIIVGEAVRGRASAFKHPEPLWRERLDEIQEARLDQTIDGPVGPRNGFRVHKPLNRLQRSKTVPIVHTTAATIHSTTLEEVDNATSLVANLEKIELPNQLVAVLADPLLQKLILLRPSAAANLRIVNWLNAVLQDVMDGDADETTLWDVMSVVRDYVVHTKHLPSAVLNFLARFLPLSVGIQMHSSVPEVLAFAPLHPFEQLYKHIYQPLEAVLIQEGNGLLTLLSVYTNLLHHWTTVLKSDDTLPEHASNTISSLIHHVDSLSMTVLHASPGLASELAILDFFEQTSRFIEDETLVRHIRVELPSSLLIYTLFFSPSLVTASRLCYVLAKYKKGLETAMLRPHRQEGSRFLDARSYERAYVHLYNGYIMDICNCFWRSRAFNDDDADSKGCMVPRPTVKALQSYVTAVDRSSSLDTLFSLSHSSGICLVSITRVRELEDAAIDDEFGTSLHTRHAGPVTIDSLKRLNTAGGLRLSWQEYRASVLHALSLKGFRGITDLLKTTIVVLRNSSDRKGLQAGSHGSRRDSVSMLLT